MTGLSLAVMIVASICGWWVASQSKLKYSGLIGGGVVGAGMASMHFVGIVSMDAGAAVSFDRMSILAATLIAMLFGAVSARIAISNQRMSANLFAASLLVVGFASMYFTAMAGMTLIPEMPARLVFGAGNAKVMALTVTIVVMSLVGFGLIFALFDFHLGGRRQAENKRIRALADATFEGLIIVRDGQIRDANIRVMEMLGLKQEDLSGRPLSEIAVDAQSVNIMAEANDILPRTAGLRCSDGTEMIVQVLARQIDFDGEAARIIALRDVSSEEKAKAKIMHMAHHDGLTGLPNRSHFCEQLEAALKIAWDDGTEVAVMVFDLDRFKDVNDVHGHATGDALLIAVAKRFLVALPENAFASRLSGDEFAVILPNVTDRVAAVSAAQHVVDTIGVPLDIGNVHINVSASGGLTMFPLDSEAPDRLMNQADLALYRAKKMGRNCVCEFDPELGALTQERRLIENDLVNAVENDLLELHYQPQAAVRSGEVVGFEALVRWNDPQRGFVPPAEFVPIAEENGLILKIGQWVLERACRDAMAWPDEQGYRSMLARLNSSREML